MKIIVVGTEAIRTNDSANHSVRSVAWQNVGKINNLGDYDHVVLLCDTLPPPQEEDVFGISNFLSRENIARVIFYNGHIVVVGDFNKKFLNVGKPRTAHSAQLAPRTSIGELLRLGVFREQSPGDNARHASYDDIPEIVRTYREYTLLIQNWKWILSRSNVDSEWYNDAARDHFPGAPSGSKFDFAGYQFLSNRHGASVAVAYIPIMQIASHYSEQGVHIKEHEFELGAIVLLPSLFIDADETIQSLLKEVWQFEARSTEPSWVEDLKPPGQSELDTKIRQIEEQVRRLAEDHESLNKDRMHKRLPLRLLYAQGTGLEEAVDDVFLAFGAKAIELNANNRADSLFAVDLGDDRGYFAIETKGTAKSSFDEKGLRQLNVWIMDCVTTVGESAKGVFIGNSEIATPPEDRNLPFGNNFLRTAELSNYAVLLSRDLYRVYEQRHLGNLDVGAFFNLLRSTNGLVDVEELIGE